jgi:hypothetical protein
MQSRKKLMSAVLGHFPAPNKMVFCDIYNINIGLRASVFA